MNADTIIAQVRSRLRDTNYENLTFSDEELLDMLQIVQTKVVSEFDTNIQTTSATLTHAQPNLTLKTPVLKLITASFEGRSVNLQIHAQALRTPPTTATLIALSPTSYTIAPFEEGRLTISANLAPSRCEMHEPLELDSLYHRAVVLGILAAMFEIETNAQNLERVRVYQALYYAECNYLRALTNAAREKPTFTTPYTKV